MLTMMSRRRFFCGCCAALGAGAVLGRGAAKAASDIVAVDFASFHYQPFHNEHMRFMNVTVPAGRVAAYHRHTVDFAQVYMAVSPTENTVLGGQPTRASRAVGEVLFNNYTKHPVVHQVVNVGSGDFRVLGFEILDSVPGRFAAVSRPAAYLGVMDNERVRAWRLILQPGEEAPPMRQAGPGVRIVVQGGELVESVEGAPDHILNLKYGDFAWQDGGVTRTIRNAGGSSVELVEFELR